MKAAVISKHYLAIGVLVLLSCFALFWLDKDTRQITDLFKSGNLVALLVYFLPTFGITAGLFWAFSKRLTSAGSMVGSLAIGIPVGFVLIIMMFLALR